MRDECVKGKVIGILVVLMGITYGAFIRKKITQTDNALG